MRVGTTLVETDVYQLTDSSLPGDGVRVEHCARTWIVSETPGKSARPTGTATRSMAT
jgi:hypothetical protein